MQKKVKKIRLEQDLNLRLKMRCDHMKVLVTRLNQLGHLVPGCDGNSINAL